MTAPRTGRLASRRLPTPVTHPDKVFWPDEGYTKLDLVNFYDAVFPQLAPFVKDRLLTLERCPDGMRGGLLLPTQGSARDAAGNAQETGAR